MPEAWLAKHEDEEGNGYLVPIEEEGRKLVNSLSVGQAIQAKVKKSRNYQNHKRFFAFIDTTFHMQEHFTDEEVYRRWLIMKAGYFHTAVAPNGTVMFFADSISFDIMEDEEKFTKLFSSCIDVFIRELGKGITQDELLRVIDFAPHHQST